MNDLARYKVTSVLSAQRESALLAPFREIWRCQRALTTTLIDEIRRKHAGAVLGRAWLLMMPVLFLAFYGATFLVVFKVKPAGTSPAEYLLFMYIGLMAFLGFSEGLTAGAGSLLVNRAILLNTVFPAEMLPLRSVLVGQTTFVLGMAIALAWSGIEGRWSWWVLIVPLVMALQIMFLIGVAWLLSPIYLIFRDLGQILNFLVLAIMVISPIAYRADALAGPVKLLLLVNPLYYFLACYQAALFDAKGPDPALLAVATAFSVTVFVGGFWLFGRVKGALAEHV